MTHRWYVTDCQGNNLSCGSWHGWWLNEGPRIFGAQRPRKEASWKCCEVKHWCTSNVVMATMQRARLTRKRRRALSSSGWGALMTRAWRGRRGVRRRRRRSRWWWGGAMRTPSHESWRGEWSQENFITCNLRLILKLYLATNFASCNF